MKTKVVFCTKVNRKGTFTKYGHLRKLRTKNYDLDRMLNVARFITIEDKDYVIKKMGFRYNQIRGMTQEIWVVPDDHN